MEKRVINVGVDIREFHTVNIEGVIDLFDGKSPLVKNFPRLYSKYHQIQKGVPHGSKV
jgi:hypothetical protein